MKIRIQSDDDFAAPAGVIEDSSVIGGRKTYVSDVLGVQAQFAQMSPSAARQALV
jgi:hypothetical protein